MPSSQAEWDAKHRLAAEEPVAEPAGLLCELLPLLPAGAALDLACGTGRNALFLAEHGRHVTAVDWSAAGLEILEARARSRNIATRRIQSLGESKGASRVGIDVLVANLESIELPANSYYLIVCVRYLQRALFPQISRALRAGGVLLYETYTQAQMEFPGGPRDAAHLLKPGELREAFPNLCLLFHRELRAGQGIASLVAQKPAGKGRSQNGD